MNVLGFNISAGLALVIGIVIGAVSLLVGIAVMPPKPLRSGMPPLYYDPFVRDLMEHGRYILGCGGGVIPEPRKAISRLVGQYGEDGLRACCLMLLFDHPEGSEFPEGTSITAMGMLYLLGDESTVETLVEIHARVPVSSPDGNPTDPYQLWHNSRERCEQLIASICHRLDKPLPDGISPNKVFNEYTFL
ncbi:MAG: hypothetical protein JXR40_03325 [Pontiellaceae bacterium]|nr:hypothetical protein [Pontiellaceae bacterium]